MEKIRIGEWDGPTNKETPVEEANSQKFQTRRKKLFQYPGKNEKEKINKNIKEKRQLWLEFNEKKRMSTPEFKDHASFVKKGVAGFAYFFTYYGLATNDGKDKVRGGIFLKINEAIIAEIKAILDVK